MFLKAVYKLRGQNLNKTMFYGSDQPRGTNPDFALEASLQVKTTCFMGRRTF